MKIGNKQVHLQGTRLGTFTLKITIDSPNGQALNNKIRKQKQYLTDKNKDGHIQQNVSCRDRRVKETEVGSCRNMNPVIQSKGIFLFYQPYTINFTLHSNSTALVITNTSIVQHADPFGDKQVLYTDLHA